MSRRSNRLQETCLQMIRDSAMLAKGDSVTVGLSGGADSVALLHFLSAWRDSWQLDVKAVHINHNLRGAESDSDEAFVRALCEKWNVPLRVVSVNVSALAVEQKQSVEVCAREQRYRVFRDVAGSGKIATAHNQNDNAETVLLNLVRGTALRGLGGIPPVRGNIIRPLLTTSREAVEAYCEEQGLRYVTDSSNRTDDYTRNRLRHGVLPLLLQENPGFLSTVSAMTDILRKDAVYLDTLAEDAMESARDVQGRFSCEALRTLPDSLRLRVLRSLLEQHRIPIERKRIQQADALLQMGGTARLSQQWYCRCTPLYLEFVPAECNRTAWQPVELQLPLSDADYEIFPGKTLRFSLHSPACEKSTQKNHKNQFKNALDCDKIKKAVTIRARLPGDRLSMANRRCTKKLRRLFQEAGIPQEMRDRILVLAVDNQVLWVEGFGADASVQADEQTRCAVWVSVDG